MLIRMTARRTHLTAVLAAAAVATGALVGGAAGADTGALVAGAAGADTGALVAGAAGADTGAPPARFALVIDSSLARDGRELVDTRLKDVEAEVRLPRNATEARTNVRYFDELGYTVVVAGSDATAAAESAGEPAVYTGGLTAALAATR
jgi:hypothetical protein